MFEGVEAGVIISVSGDAAGVDAQWTSSHEAASSPSRAQCCDVACRISVHIDHGDCFLRLVFLGVLDDVERADPQVPVAQPSCELHGFSESLRQLIEWYLFLEGLEVANEKPEHIAFAPHVAEAEVLQLG